MIIQKIMNNHTNSLYCITMNNTICTTNEGSIGLRSHSIKRQLTILGTEMETKTVELIVREKVENMHKLAIFDVSDINTVWKRTRKGYIEVGRWVCSMAVRKFWLICSKHPGIFPRSKKKLKYFCDTTP